MQNKTFYNTYGYLELSYHNEIIFLYLPYQNVLK